MIENRIEIGNYKPMLIIVVIIIIWVIIAWITSIRLRNNHKYLLCVIEETYVEGVGFGQVNMTVNYRFSLDGKKYSSQESFWAGDTIFRASFKIGDTLIVEYYPPSPNNNKLHEKLKVKGKCIIYYDTSECVLDTSQLDTIKNINVFYNWYKERMKKNE